MGLVRREGRLGEQGYEEGSTADSEGRGVGKSGGLAFGLGAVVTDVSLVVQVIVASGAHAGDVEGKLGFASTAERPRSGEEVEEVVSGHHSKGYLGREVRSADPGIWECFPLPVVCRALVVTGGIAPAHDVEGYEGIGGSVSGEMVDLVRGSKGGEVRKSHGVVSNLLKLYTHTVGLECQG